MKHFGSRFEYEEERNADLIRAYREEIADCDVIVPADVFKKVVNSPSRRFWVSEERAAIVISALERGAEFKSMGPVKRRMYAEIYTRYKELRKSFPDARLYDLVAEVVEGPAPEFYLTEGSAKVIVSKIKKKWYEKRKQRK